MQNNPLTHLTERDRYNIIVKVEHDQLPIAQVAQDCGVSRQTVYNVLRKWTETGKMEEEHSTGRIPNYSDKDMKKLNRLIKQHPNAEAEELLTLMRSSAPRVSSRTIRNYRHSLGYTPRRTQPEHILSDSQKVTIHAFAVQHQHSDMRRWVYLDECTVQLRDTGDVVWIMRGEPTPTHPISHLRAAVHVWGAVWWTHRCFSRYEGHLTANTYIALLDEYLSPYRDEIRRKSIAEDNAPYHNATRVKRWFQDQGLHLLDWPAYAKKFNAIEYCWGWMKQTIKRAQPQTPIQLCQAIDTACTLLPQKVVQSFILHAQRNLRQEAQR